MKNTHLPKTITLVIEEQPVELLSAIIRYSRGEMTVPHMLALQAATNRHSSQDQEPEHEQSFQPNHYATARNSPSVGGSRR